jgi:hypothetical protein
VSRNKLTVLELELPGLLVALIEQGRWVCPTSKRVLDRVFACADLTECRFYTPEEMERETATLMKYRLDYSGDRPVHVAAVPDAAPGNMDFSQAACIGHIGYDAPICLDYRRAPRNPSVAVLYVRWEQVAPDFQTSAETLEL